MKYIEIKEHGCALKISDDETYQNLMLYPRDENELKNYVIKLTVELLKAKE